MKLNYKLFLYSVILFSGALETQAEELSKKIDKVMEKFVELDQFSGSILLAKNGKVIYADAFGEADKGHNVKNNLKTKFDTGSIGKIFAGISIMQLEERGKLQVTDPVIKHIKDFPFGNKITIHHLLNHTSGMGNFFSHADYRFKKYELRNIDQALSLIYEQKLLFDSPGERFSYSNSGIVILGAIVEKITGQKYSNYIEKNIFSPLKMTDTGYYFLDEVIDNRAVGYIKKLNGRYVRNIFRVPTVNPSGGFNTSVEDLFKLDRALYGNQLLNEQSKQKMFTAYERNYGYTSYVENRHGNKIVGHGGGAPGISAMFLRFLNDQYTLIVLSNYDLAAVRVANTVESIVFKQKYEMPRLEFREFLYKQLVDNGVHKVINGLDKILAKNAYEIKSSQVLNRFGYDLMELNKPEMAIEMFKLNIRLFPGDANLYDSLGDAYDANGQLLKAQEQYEKAADLGFNNKDDEHRMQMFENNLKRIRKKIAQQAIIHSN